MPSRLSDVNMCPSLIMCNKYKQVTFINVYKQSPYICYSNRTKVTETKHALCPCTHPPLFIIHYPCTAMYT
jgi:hypothetical protein